MSIENLLVGDAGGYGHEQRAARASPLRYMSAAGIALCSPKYPPAV